MDRRAARLANHQMFAREHPHGFRDLHTSSGTTSRTTTGTATSAPASTSTAASALPEVEGRVLYRGRLLSLAIYAHDMTALLLWDGIG